MAVVVETVGNPCEKCVAEVTSGNRPVSEGATMDITAVRNAYGRQLGSFEAVAPFAGAGNIQMTFIRAPVITHVGKNVEVLAEVDGIVVAAREDNQLVLSFHPELGEDTSVHQYFLDMISGTN